MPLARDIQSSFSKFNDFKEDISQFECLIRRFTFCILISEKGNCLFLENECDSLDAHRCFGGMFLFIKKLYFSIVESSGENYVFF